MNFAVTKLLEAALHYASLGYYIFPCIPGEKRPILKGSFKGATTNIEQIEAWWLKWPNANIGLRTDGLLVVDIDGADNPWLSDEPEKVRELSIAPIAITGRKGKHFLFRQPEGAQLGCTQHQLATKV